jgi:thiol:disulfide interchange protein DsbD
MHKIKTLLQFSLYLLLALAIQTANAITAEDLLSPQQAFQISANGSSANKILVKWRIAEGYYLYQSKIRFSTDSENITLSSPDFPPAEIKKDDFFGEVSIYRDEIII